MGHNISTNFNRDINFCSTINVNEPANTQIENRSDAPSNQNREISTQVDEDIEVQESDQVSSNGRIKETSNHSSYELRDKSTQVDKDIAVQESSRLTSKGQTDKRLDRSSDQVKHNSGDDLIDLAESSGIDSKDSVASTISTKERFNQRPSLVPTKKFSDRNIKSIIKNQIPAHIEICATINDRDWTIENDCQKRIVGVYHLIEMRNGEPCYQHSRKDESNKQPRLQFKRLRKYTNKGCWVIGPILHPFYKKYEITLRLRKVLPTIKAHEYEFETPWNQYYDCVGLNPHHEESYRIEIGVIQIKALSEKEGTMYSIRSTSPF